MNGQGEGLTCVVTGATSGIGRETARLLAGRGGTLIGVGRDPQRCEEAARDIRRSAENARVLFLPADLSSQSELRGLAARIAAQVDRIDVLVNNAGTFTLARKETVDGVEMQLAVNWLAGFTLTGLLMPKLQAAKAARIVTLSSGSHFAGRMRWDDMGMHRGYHGLKAYNRSKLATVLFTYELARRLPIGSPLRVHAVDPGLVRTDIGAKGSGRFVQMVWRIRTRGGISPARAAESVVFCASDPSIAHRTGLYWKECRPLPSSRISYDAGEAGRLWRLGESLSGIRYP